MIAYIYGQDNVLSVHVNGQNFTIHDSHPNFKSIQSAILNNQEQRLLELINLKETIVKRSSSKIQLKNSQLYYEDRCLDDVLTERAIDIIKNGHDLVLFEKFLDNLFQNPSNNSVTQLYKFLEKKCLPLTDDGCFLAYKCVTSDFKDKYTGTIDNSIGSKPLMLRNLVSDDSSKGCEPGLHCGALDYSGPDGYYYKQGDKVVIVKVNPANVVSVPKDCSYSKVRVTTYEVIAEYKSELNKPLYCYNEELVCEPKAEENVDMSTLVTDFEDIWVGDTITFIYHEKARKLLVTDIDDYNEMITGLINDSEKDYKSFLFSKMKNIKYVDET